MLDEVYKRSPWVPEVFLRSQEKYELKISIFLTRVFLASVENPLATRVTKDFPVGNSNFIQHGEILFVF